MDKKNQKKGRITIHIGPMGACKTTHAALTAEKCIREKKKVCVVKFQRDNRFKEGSEKIMAHNGLMINDNVKSVLSLSDIDPRGYDVIIIDEIQAFGSESVEQTMESVKLLFNWRKNYAVDIYCYGLHHNMNGEVFKLTGELMKINDRLKHSTAKCCVCGDTAAFTEMVKKPDMPIIAQGFNPGGMDEYEPRCFEHFSFKSFHERTRWSYEEEESEDTPVSSQSAQSTQQTHSYAQSAQQIQSPKRKEDAPQSVNVANNAGVQSVTQMKEKLDARVKRFNERLTEVIGTREIIDATITNNVAAIINEFRNFEPDEVEYIRLCSFIAADNKNCELNGVAFMIIKLASLPATFMKLFPLLDRKFSIKYDQKNKRFDVSASRTMLKKATNISKDETDAVIKRISSLPTSYASVAKN